VTRELAGKLLESNNFKSTVSENRKTEGRKKEASQKAERTKNGKNNDKLKCLYFNARSLVSKIRELELLARTENIDVIGITETWLTADIQDSEMSIEGYTLLRKDRNDDRKKKGGGVAFYIKNELNLACCDDIFEIDFPESLFCNIICEKDKTLVGVCYRPPSSKDANDRALYSLLSKVSKDRLIVMGDFNFPELKWSQPESLSDSHLFLKCLNDNFLEQLVDEPTRGNNILDLVITSDISIINSVTVGEPFETSDHQVIRFELIGKRSEVHHNKAGFNYFKANYVEIRKFAAERNWNLIAYTEDIG
jgi:hypothetical protein